MKLTVRSRSYGKQHTQDFSGSYYAKSRIIGDEYEYMHIELLTNTNAQMFVIKTLILDRFNYADLKYESELRTHISDKAQEVLFQLHKPNFKGSWEAITQQEWDDRIQEALSIVKSQNKKAPF